MGPETEFDVAILGGGISGLGVAMLASQSGKRVCLIEQTQCGRGTSNNSLRIIHGGLRYLQKLDFPRIISSVADQTFCLHKWPELIKPLRCVAPLSGRGLKRANLARMATVLYSCFLGALNSPLERPYVDARSEYEGLPFLKDQAAHGYLIWQDALLLDHLALIEKLLLEIKAFGMKIYENTVITGLIETSSGLNIHCKTGTETKKIIQAKTVVNCLGPAWTYGASPFSNKWCCAFNLILKRQIHPTLAFGCDGERSKYFFFVPRQNQTVLGTGYIEVTENAETSVLPDWVIDEFINSAGKAALALQLSRDDIAEVESGILPMSGLDSMNQPVLLGSSKVQRVGRVVHVLCSKYTTFRSQALEVMKHLK